jgi:hypothetical protein
VPSISLLPHKVRNVPAIVPVNGVAGTFVLITQNAEPSNATPPPMNTSGATAAWSGTVGLNGNVSIKVPYGTNGLYYYTCWVPTSCGSQIKYVQTTSVHVNSGTAITPNQPVPTVTCETPSCP